MLGCWCVADHEWRRGRCTRLWLRLKVEELRGFVAWCAPRRKPGLVLCLLPLEEGTTVHKRVLGCAGGKATRLGMAGDGLCLALVCAGLAMEWVPWRGWCAGVRGLEWCADAKAAPGVCCKAMAAAALGMRW